MVLGVGGQGLGVGRVRARGLDLVDEALVPEELADVGDGASGQGAVGELGGALVDDDVLRDV